MTSTWQTVRVFISSTFRDMHAERDHLVKVTFPRLRSRLEQYHIHLIDIDLRWGVTKEQAENDRVLDLCLKQIDTCRPFFIGILGDRYGWILENLNEMDGRRFGTAQALTGKSITELEILHGVLRNPKMKQHASFFFRKSDFVNALDETHKMIFTEMAYDYDVARVGIQEATSRAAERKRKLAALKQEIRCWCEKSGALIHEYSCQWDAARPSPEEETAGRLVGLEQFGEWVEADLWAAILREYPQVAEVAPPPAVEGTPAWLDEEQDYHERFTESRLQMYVERKDTQQQLLEYVTSDVTTPLLFSGTGGSGKSAILSWLWQHLRDCHSDDCVLLHCVGASPSSADLGPMLRRFCMVLRNLIEKKTRAGKDAPDTLPHAVDIPDDPAELPITFGLLLRQLSPEQCVVLIIDAVNQLDECGDGQKMNWLPTDLLPHVKVIVSCAEESGHPQPALRVLRARKIPEIRVVPLAETERHELVTSIPALSAKTLDPKQIELLLANPATNNPLYLSVALEELRGFGSFERLNERIASFPRQEGAAGLIALFDQVLARQESEIDGQTIRAALALIASSRTGLSETELTDMLAETIKDGLHVDRVQVLLRQLRPYLLRRGELVDFSHRSLWKAVSERYLTPCKLPPSGVTETTTKRDIPDNSDSEHVWQRILAKYFYAQGIASLRMLTETAYHMVRGAMWDEIESLLANWHFLEAKTQRLSVFNLADDFELAMQSIPSDREKRAFLELVSEAIHRDINFIAAHRSDNAPVLFQCLWNTCWWHDCADLPDFVCAPVTEKTRDSDRHAGPLSIWMEEWRREKEASDNFSWLRSLRPPNIPLGEGFLGVLQGHTGFVTAIAASPDGRNLASGAADGSVCIWDTASLRLLQRGHLFKSAVFGLAFDPLGTSQLACCTYNGTLAILRIRESEITVDAIVSNSEDYIIECANDEFFELCFSEQAQNEQLVSLQNKTLQRLQRASKDIRHEGDSKRNLSEQSGLMWDAAAGKLAFAPDAHSPISLSWSGCGRYLGAVRNGIPVIWEVRNEKGEVVPYVSQTTPLLEAMFPALSLIGAVQDNKQGYNRVGTRVTTLKNLCVYNPGGFVCARDGVWFAVCNKGACSLTIDPAATIVRGNLMPNVEPCSSSEGCPYIAAISPDGRYVVTGGLEGAVRVCETETFHLLWERDYRGVIQAISWSAKTSGPYLGLSDGEIAILVGDGNYMDALRLDPQTGSELGRRPVPNHPLSPFLSYSSATQTMFAITAGGEIHAWSERSAITPQQLSLANKWVSCLHFLPDGELILHADVLGNVTFVEARTGPISRTKLPVMQLPQGAKQCRQWVTHAAFTKDDGADKSAGMFCLAYGNGVSVVGTFHDGQIDPCRWMAETSPILCVDSGQGVFVLGREDGRLVLWEHGTFKSVGGDIWQTSMPKSPIRALAINPTTQEVAFGNDSGEIFIGHFHSGWWTRIHGKPLGPSMMTDRASGIAVIDVQKRDAQEKRITPVIGLRWQDDHSVLCQHADGTSWRLRISGSLPSVSATSEPYHEEFRIADLDSIPQTATELVFAQHYSAGSTLMNLKIGKAVAHWPVPFADRKGAIITASPTEKVWAASSGSQFYLFRLEGDAEECVPNEPMRQNEDSGSPQHDVGMGDALTRCHSAAKVREDQGDWVGAENVYRELLAARQRLQGSDHPDTLETMFSLASLLRRKGVLDEAERLHREALETRKRVLPPDHPDTLASLVAVALIRKQRGAYDEAEMLYKQALAEQIKTLGSEHDGTLTTKSNLGRLYEAREQYEKAEPLLRDVVSVRVRTLGAAHPETLMSMHNLSSVLECMNRDAEAEKFERTAYEGMNRLNPESEDTLLCAHDLAYLLRKKHTPKAALPLCQKVLEGFIRIYGPNHPRTIQAYQELDAVKKCSR